MSYEMRYVGEQKSFNGDVLSLLAIRPNHLYEFLYRARDTGFAMPLNNRDGLCLGRNIVDCIRDLKFVEGDIVLRGPVKIVGEEQ